MPIKAFLIFLLLSFITPAFIAGNSSLFAQDLSEKSENIVSTSDFGINQFHQNDMQNTEQTQTPTRVWLSFGFGLTTPEDYGPHFGITFRRNQHLFGARIAGSGEIFGKNYNDIALLYGRATSLSSRVDLHLSTGAAVVMGERSGLNTNTRLFRPAPGLPLQAQLNWNAAPVAGLGLTAFGNINARQSFAGIAVSVNIGNLRSE